MIPTDDPSIDALDPKARAAVSAHWAHRASSELSVSRLFVGLASELRAARADAAVVAIAERAIADERRHAEICREVAARYGDAKVEALPMPPLASDGDAEVTAALHVAALCCVQESLACAWLDECFANATGAIARAALHQLLVDEVAHARLGWAHLASARVSARTREEIAAHLPHMLERCLEPWRAPDASRVSDGVPAHGIPSDARTLAVVTEALRGVVIPGMRVVGVSTDAASRALDRLLSS
jgi:hypothetical protein